MDELAPGIEALRRALKPAWNRARRERLFARIRCSQRRRRRMLLGGCATSFVVLAALGMLLTAAGEQRRAPPSAASPPAAAAVTSQAGWRSLYLSGDYDAAARSLLEAGSEVVDDPATLMDAAELARLVDRPEAAAGYLRRVVREHARSPIAPFAGFMLGRVLLERLGQPAEAAEAFSLARTIAPHGSLAQDALAREVEAWSKAGLSTAAYERARLYVQLYPAGRRVRAVRLFGGLP